MRRLSEMGLLRDGGWYIPAVQRDLVISSVGGGLAEWRGLNEGRKRRSSAKRGRPRMRHVQDC